MEGVEAPQVARWSTTAPSRRRESDACLTAPPDSEAHPQSVPLDTTHRHKEGRHGQASGASVVRCHRRRLFGRCFDYRDATGQGTLILLDPTQGTGSFVRPLSSTAAGAARVAPSRRIR